jgi:DUF1680 family protein
MQKTSPGYELPVRRRDFLVTAASALAARASAVEPVQTSLHFHDVRLTGGLLADRFNLNARRTFAIPPADILMPFFRAKGLSNGGRELNPGFPQGRQSIVWPGLYSGFWMSGAAHIARWSGDPSHRETLARMARDLAKTRESDGFVLAMGREPAERWAHSDLYALIRVTIRAMLDIYELTGEKAALDVARGQADCMLRDIQGNPGTGEGILLRGADPAKVLPNWYKLLPALSQLYRHTGDERYRKTAAMCLDLKFMDSVLEGKRDLLPNRHASTWVDHLLGAYQLGLDTGDRRYQDFALRAAQRIREHHLFLTGSMSSDEEFRPGVNGWQLPENLRAQETCCAAIWITLLEALLRGTGDFVHADCIESAAYNALFASQSPLTGDFCYFVNLSGNGKPYDPPPEWGRHCCEGTGLMAIGRLPGLIYGKRADGLAVNLYAASEASLDVNGVRVRIAQETRYPDDGLVRLRLDPARPLRFALHYRVPAWCAGEQPSIHVNGAAWTGEPGPLTREWKSGDEVLLRFPVRAGLVYDTFNGTPRAALRYGPLVMAATWNDDLPVRKASLNKVIHGSHSHFEQWPDLPSLDTMPVAGASNRELTFEAAGVAPPVPGVAPPSGSRVALRYVPFSSAIRSKYSVWLPLHRSIV